MLDMGQGLSDFESGLIAWSSRILGEFHLREAILVNVQP